MGRIRTIKPEFPLSETMGKVSRDARLTFILLFTVADDSGRLRGVSRMLANTLFPYDNDVVDQIDGWLKELEKASAIWRYKVKDESFIQILNWTKHQKIDKPTASKLPSIEEGSPKPPRAIVEDSPTAQIALGMGLEGKGKEGNGSGGESSAVAELYTPAFLQFWAQYPRKDGKADAFSIFQKAKLGPSLPAIIAALEWQTRLTDWTKEGGQYVPLASTYLNKKRWLDEAPAKKARGVVC